METLRKDVETLDLSEGQRATGMTLLEAVGYDIDSAYGEMKQTVIRNDKNAISIGGQNGIGANQQFQIRLTDQDALQDLGSLMLTGYYQGYTAAGAASAPNLVPFNMAMLFKGIYMKIGGVQVSFADSDVYQQMQLQLTARPEILPHADGLWMPTADFDDQKVANSYVGLKQATLKRSGLRKDGSFAIPLWVIFPALKSFDDMTLYTGVGEQIEFSIQTQPYPDCVFDSANTHVVDGEYRLDNMAIVYQYSRLDSLRNDLILRNQFAWHPTIIQNYKVGSASASINLNFSVSKGEKLKRLLFCFAPNFKRAANDITDAASLYTYNIAGPVGNELASKLWEWPKVLVRQLELNAGGDRVVLNSMNFPIMQLLQPSQTFNSEIGYAGTYFAGFWKDIHCVYALDLSRYSRDLIGATSKNQIQLVVNIQIDTAGIAGTAGINYADLIPLAGSSVIGANISNFDCYSYLEKSSPMYLKNGKYSHASL